MRGTTEPTFSLPVMAAVSLSGPLVFLSESHQCGVRFTQNAGLAEKPEGGRQRAFFLFPHDHVMYWSPCSQHHTYITLLCLTADYTQVPCTSYTPRIMDHIKAVLYTLYCPYQIHITSPTNHTHSTPTLQYTAQITPIHVPPVRHTRPPPAHIVSHAHTVHTSHPRSCISPLRAP